MRASVGSARYSSEPAVANGVPYLQPDGSIVDIDGLELEIQPDRAQVRAIGEYALRVAGHQRRLSDGGIPYNQQFAGLHRGGV